LQPCGVPNSRRNVVGVMLEFFVQNMDWNEFSDFEEMRNLIIARESTAWKNLLHWYLLKTAEAIVQVVAEVKISATVMAISDQAVNETVGSISSPYYYSSPYSVLYLRYSEKRNKTEYQFFRRPYRQTYGYNPETHREYGILRKSGVYIQFGIENKIFNEFLKEKGLFWNLINNLNLLDLSNISREITLNLNPSIKSLNTNPNSYFFEISAHFGNRTKPSVQGD
jgi:hypothetical protein